MEKQYFVVFKKQEDEIKNAYSIVDEKHLQSIPQDIILTKKEIEDKLYTTKELEDLTDSLI